jgi:hypothetical protein
VYVCLYACVCTAMGMDVGGVWVESDDACVGSWGAEAGGRTEGDVLLHSMLTCKGTSTNTAAVGRHSVGSPSQTRRCPCPAHYSVAWVACRGRVPPLHHWH